MSLIEGKHKSNQNGANVFYFKVVDISCTMVFMFITVYNVFCHVRTHIHTLITLFYSCSTFQWSLSSSQLVRIMHFSVCNPNELHYKSMCVGFLQEHMCITKDFTTEENPLLHPVSISCIEILREVCVSRDPAPSVNSTVLCLQT